jgi:DNA-binding response OmpR family regulator
VVDGDLDVRESLRRGLLMRCLDFAADTNVVDVLIGYLRSKLESARTPNLLRTVGGIGFPLRAR